MALINHNNKVPVSQLALRRVVERVPPIGARHASDAAIRVAVTLAEQAGHRFAEKHDGRKNAEVRRAKTQRDGEEHTARAEELLRVWRPLLGALLSFEPSAFTPASHRPVDVIVTVKGLIAYADGQSGTPLPPEAVEALAQLRELIKLAEARWNEARGALVDVQTRAQESRDAAFAFHEALVILRRVVGNVLGRSHHDYRALRYARATTDETAVEIIDDASDVTAADAPEGDRESGEFAPVKAVAS